MITVSMVHQTQTGCDELTTVICVAPPVKPCMGKFNRIFSGSQDFGENISVVHDSRTHTPCIFKPGRNDSSSERKRKGSYSYNAEKREKSRLNPVA
jgi:hypothetical protein